MVTSRLRVRHTADTLPLPLRDRPAIPAVHRGTLSADADMRQETPDSEENEDGDEFEGSPTATQAGEADLRLPSRPRKKIQRFNSEDMRAGIEQEEAASKKVELVDYTGAEARKIAERQRRKQSLANQEALLGIGADGKDAQNKWLGGIEKTLKSTKRRAPAKKKMSIEEKLAERLAKNQPPAVSGWEVPIPEAQWPPLDIYDLHPPAPEPEPEPELVDAEEQGARDQSFLSVTAAAEYLRCFVLPDLCCCLCIQRAWMLRPKRREKQRQRRSLPLRWLLTWRGSRRRRRWNWRSRAKP